MFGEGLTIGIVIAAAAADSINPCVFGVLIFLIAFMNKAFKTRRMMLAGGIFYTAVVYATYLALGFGILKLTLGIGISQFFYAVVAGIAIIAGLLEIKDYFWYGKGFTLQLFPGSAKRLEYFTKRVEAMEVKHPAFLFLVTAILGVFVVFVELPCTGAPYFAILGLLGAGDYAQAVPLLLLYNFIFIVPLLIIIGIAYFGTSSDRLESWRKEHRGLMRLAIGAFLIALGAYMIYSII